MRNRAEETGPMAHSSTLPEPDAGFHIALPKDIEGRIAPFAKPAVQRILRLQELNALYDRVTWPNDDVPVWDRILRSLNVAYQVAPEDMAGIPPRGPLVVVANHPYGGIEGIILAALLRSVRPDVKVMANLVLGTLPCLHEWVISVDPFGRESSTMYNIQGLKAAIQWLKSGGVLVVFPAGEVAHVDIRQRVITDPPWHSTVAALIRRTGASAIPVFFSGSNGPMFQVLSMVHPMLRTVMLPSELLNKRNHRFEVRIGHSLSFQKLKAFSGDEEMTAYLRWRTYLLGNRQKCGQTPGAKPGWGIGRPRVAVSVPAQPEPAQLEAEISGLGSDQTLLQSGEDAVILASAQQLPTVMREIGRLREVTFRSVGEGTGRAIDLDEFDPYYLHLFVWRKSRRQIVGAYRLGQTDLILKERGIKGLYTSTLFEFKEAFFERLGPAVEMGRSFVRLEFQGAMNALPLLWKGIGRFITRNPRYKILFGPVSISNRYHPLSRHMMVSYLQQNHLTREISGLLKPKAPFKRHSMAGWQPQPICYNVKDVDELSELISDIEADRKRVPVLLKHYLKLGGKVVGFNVDSSFSHVVDGLIVVDLTETDRYLLDRFLTSDAAGAFLAHHHPVSTGL